MPDTFFRIEMLTALEGDAIWVEYGTMENQRRILIDGGPIGAYDDLEKKLKTLPKGDQRVELLVVSHVDTDHIEGIIRLLAHKFSDWLIKPDDIWFNGWRHLKESGMLGGREGDFLSAIIHKRIFKNWNKAFSGKTIVVDPDKPLPVKYLKDGMKITLLSPEPEKLLAMADKWAQDEEKFGLDPGDFEKAAEQLAGTAKYHAAEGMLGGEKDYWKSLEKQLKVDPSIANGTSIAFLVEFSGKSCLFLADAHQGVICKSLRKLIPTGQKRLKVDAVKLSHHGSKSNISKELMASIDAKHFLISTNGDKHNHPNKSAIDAVIKWSAQDPTLWFNYRSEQNAIWEKGPENGERNFTTRYPEKITGGIVIEL
jgi:beta-lactamase superfamily II metal-dependent hydrolase